MERIARQEINGYLEVIYRKDGFIEVRDMEKNVSITIYKDIFKLINKTIKKNERREK